MDKQQLSKYRSQQCKDYQSSQVKLDRNPATLKSEVQV